MFKKIKVKKYLNTKESFDLFDDVLSFYTTLYMKEVFHFWGLKHVSITIVFENDIPADLNVSGFCDNIKFHWSLNRSECTYQLDNEIKTPSMNSFNTIHQLFDFMRDQLPKKDL